MSDEVIIWGETPTSDRNYVEFIGLKDCSLQAEEYVIVENDDYRYLHKIEERPVHFSPTLGREDPASLSALYRKLGGDIKQMATEAYSMKHYKGKLIGRQDKTNQEFAEGLTGPVLGSLGRRATDREVIAFLSLPDIDPRLQLGRFFHTHTPVCFSALVLRHHGLIAGATGEGKSTLITNVIHGAAMALDASVFLMDFKPDYQTIECPASERSAIPPEQIHYWLLNERKAFRSEGTKQVNVHFSEINTELYMQMASSTETMYEGFLDLAKRYERLMHEQNRQTWTCWDFYRACPKTQKDDSKIRQFYESPDEAPHEFTLKALNRVTRYKPNWVDHTVRGEGIRQGMSQGRSFFAESNFLTPGHIHVIQANVGLDRHYGLFMTTLMEKILTEKEAQGLTHPVLIIVDEAQDIFNGSAFAKQCETHIASVIRKGRSQKIGVMIAVQSADSVPPLIANNLHSVVAFRHNSEDAAGYVKKLMGSAATHLQELEPGNVLIKMFGAKAVVRARLDLEAFELVKSE